MLRKIWSTLKTPYDLIASTYTPATKNIIITKAGLTLFGSIMCGFTMRSNIDFLSASIMGVMAGNPKVVFENRRGMAIFIASSLASSIINYYSKSLVPDMERLTEQFVDSEIANHQKALTLFRDAHPDYTMSPKQIKDAYNFFLKYVEQYLSIATSILAQGTLYYLTNSPKEKVGTVLNKAIDIFGLNRIVSLTSLACFAATMYATYKVALVERKTSNVDEALLSAFNNRLLTDDFTYLGILSSISNLQKKLFEAFWTQHQKEQSSPRKILLKAAQIGTNLMAQSQTILTLTFSMYMGRDVFMNELVQSTSILPNMISSDTLDSTKILDAFFTITFFQVALKTSNQVKYVSMNVDVAAKLSGTLYRAHRNLGSFVNNGLTIKYGQLTLIQGVSGCGKSTLGKILTDMTCAAAGSTQLDTTLQSAGMIQYITSREIASVPELTLRAFLTSEASSNDKELSEILAKVNLAKLSLDDPIPPGLSNGEGKKLLLAKAMAQKSRLIVLDETLASFSSKSIDEMSERDKIMKVVKQYAKDNNCAVIIISHEADLEKYTDSLIIFEEQQIKQETKSR